MITTQDIKELRDRTGVSIMQCREALTAAGGDMEKALELLKKKSGDIAEKKSDRTLGAGVVSSYVHGGSIGAMVKLMCETDFVARNPEFKALAEDIAMHVSAMNPEFVSEKEVSDDIKGAIRAGFEAEAASMDKPADLKAKIVDGKVAAYFKERSLIDQPFIKTPELTVGDIIKAGTQKFGERIEVGKIVRVSLVD
ncbi:MAG: elongation factor Ts [Patescibacteria group bacterium]